MWWPQHDLNYEFNVTHHITVLKKVSARGKDDCSIWGARRRSSCVKQVKSAGKKTDSPPVSGGDFDGACHLPSFHLPLCAYAIRRSMPSVYIKHGCQMNDARYEAVAAQLGQKAIRSRRRNTSPDVVLPTRAACAITRSKGDQQDGEHRRRYSQESSQRRARVSRFMARVAGRTH